MQWCLPSLIVVGACDRRASPSRCLLPGVRLLFLAATLLIVSAHSALASPGTEVVGREVGCVDLEADVWEGVEEKEVQAAAAKQDGDWGAAASTASL